MTDTLQTIVNTVQQSSNESIDLIYKVDAFYNSAWNKLIYGISILFGLVGIIVPIIIQRYQKKTLKISGELLNKNIETQTSKIKAEILKEINKDFESKTEELNAFIVASTFHLQGNSQIDNKTYSGALSDYIIAATNYIKCNNYINLQIVMNIILEACLPHLSLDEINDLKEIENHDLYSLLVLLDTSDEAGVFKEVIRNIRLSLRELSKTNNEKQT